MKIAVSGASGFIGQHVCQELSKRGIQILRVARHLGLEHQSHNHDTSTETVYLDYLDPTPAELTQIASCDGLIHLAWGGLPNYLSNEHFETELPTHYRFLKQLVDHGLSSLLVTGTCFEYGMQSGSLSEQMPAFPSNPYGFAKKTLFDQLHFLQKEKHFALQWPRLFYMYGEGQPPKTLYALFQSAVARGEKYFPMSAGEQLRDYLSVSKIAEILVDLAISKQDIGVINVGSGTPTSIRSLVESWVTAQSADIQLELGKFPYPNYEPMAFWADTKKLTNFIETSKHHD